MNYKQNYFDFMQSRQSLSRSKSDGVYYELHHILPKSIYPEYEKLPGNLVLLTPREHFLAHYLLTKMFEGEQKYKMLCALMRMTHGNEPLMKFTSSRLYAKKRLEYIEYSKKWHKEHPPVWTEEDKKRISMKEKGKKVPQHVKNVLSQKTKEQFADEVKRERHRQAMIKWYNSKDEDFWKKQREWSRKPRGKYSQERVEKARQASTAGTASIICIEDGTTWSAVRLAKETGIQRHKIKILIEKGELINGKRYQFFRKYGDKSKKD